MAAAEAWANFMDFLIEVAKETGKGVLLFECSQQTLLGMNVMGFLFKFNLGLGFTLHGT